METLLQAADALTLAEADAAVDALLTMAEADAAVDALLTMAAGMLEGALARVGTHLSAHVMLEKALRFIDHHLASSDLSPALLEASLPLSRSSLYRLFEPLGGVGNAILQRRLDRSMKVLLTGSAAKPPLRAIARDRDEYQSEE